MICNLRKYIDEEYEGDPVTVMDGFDSAIMGLGMQANNAAVVYDYNKCIEILKDSMTEEEAVEYFEFNIGCAFVGQTTPVIFYKPTKQSDKPVIYISGPMTGYPDFNFPEFDRAKELLEKDGWSVLSPADMDREMGFEGIGKTGNEVLPKHLLDTLITQDIEAVREADAIYMINGWEKSKGARAEKALAEWEGKQVIFCRNTLK